MKKLTQKGVTLIELMIAVALGALVIIGVASSLSSMNLSNNTQMTQNNIQQDSKLVLDFYETQIRKSASSVLNSLSTTLPKHINVQTRSTTVSGSPLGVQDFIAGVIPEANNTITLIFSGDKYGLNPTTNQTFMDRRPFRLSRALPARYVNGMVVTFMISDGERVDVFDASLGISNPGQPPRLTPLTGLSMTYKIEDALLTPLSFVNYSVNAPNLIERDLTFNRRNTIATNVDAVEYIFGIDRSVGGASDGSVDMYATSADIRANQNLARGIISVDVYLLTRDSENRIDVTISSSPNPRNNTVNTFSMPNPAARIVGSTGVIPMAAPLTFIDRIPRKLFRRTITMRNKARMFN